MPKHILASMDGLNLTLRPDVGAVKGEDDAEGVAGGGPVLSPVEKAEVSESEDVADRAASLLKGLRRDDTGDDDTLHVRRRREKAQDERNARRMRRRTAQAGTSSGNAGTGGGSDTPKLEAELDGEGDRLDSPAPAELDGDTDRDKTPTPTPTGRRG